MPSFLSKIKALASPSLSKRNAKSSNDLNSTLTAPAYIVKEKDLPKLHLAAWRGDMAKVSEYCRADKINLQDKDGRTPLHLAVAGNHKLIANYLINEDAKFNFLDKENRTVFTLAAMNGNSDILRLLLSSCKEKDIINTVDKRQLNALHYAIRSEKAISLLRILLDCNKIELNHRDKDGNTVLHVATGLRNYEAVQLLIKREADIDEINIEGLTPLMVSARNGDEVLVKLFLDNGCNRNLRDKQNKTAEDYAKSFPTCLDVFYGISRPKSFSAASKYLKNGKPPVSQVNRRASWNNDGSTSEHIQSSKGENKFENLFAAAAITQMNDDNDSDSNTSKISINVQQNENDGHITTRSEKLNSWNDNSDVLDDMILHRKPETLGKPSVLSSFISNLGQGYESPRKNMVNSPDSDKKPEKSAHNVSFAFDVNKKTNENPDSWNDHDSFIGSALNSPKKSTTENYDSIFNTHSLDRPKKNDAKAVDANKLKKDDNSWLSDTYPAGEQKSSLEEKLSSLLILNAEIDKKTMNTNQKSQNSWFVTVYTSNIKNAGTDARVYIKIFGTKATSDKIWLDKEEYQNKIFEKGSCDKFLKSLPDIGDPVKITIGHDNTGPFPGWHLEKVVLDDIRRKKQFEFKCERWLAKNEADRKIEIDIKLGGGENTDDKNSWNSSEDEDSSISLSKDKVFQQTPTRDFDDPKDPKESTGDSKSIINIIQAAIKSEPNKPWSNENNFQGPPEISDIEDDPSMIDLVDNRGHLETPVYAAYKEIKNAQMGPVNSSLDMQKNLLTIGNNTQQKQNESLTKNVAKSDNFVDLADNNETSIDLSTDAIERELNLSKARVTTISLNEPYNIIDKSSNNKYPSILIKQIDVNEPHHGILEDEEESNYDEDFSSHTKSGKSSVASNAKPVRSSSSFGGYPPKQNRDRSVSRDSSARTDPNEEIKQKTSDLGLSTNNSALSVLVNSLKDNPKPQISKTSTIEDSGVGSMVSTVERPKNEKSIKSISSNIDELVQSLSPKRKSWEKAKTKGEQSNQSSQSSPGLSDHSAVENKKNPNISPSKSSSKAPPKAVKFEPPSSQQDKTEVTHSHVDKMLLMFSPKKESLAAVKSENTKQVKGLKDLINDLKTSKAEKDHDELVKKIESDYGDFSSDLDEDMEMALQVEPPPNFQKSDTKPDLKLNSDLSNVEITTSDSDILARNIQVLSKTTNKQKIQSERSLKSLIQQVDQKQAEITRLTSLLQETMSQKSDLEFKKSSLDNQLKLVNEQKQRLELELTKAEKKLIEKEKLHMEMANSTNKSEVLAKSNLVEIQALKKEISELRDEKTNLENKVAILQSTNNQQATNVAGSAPLMNTLNEQNEKLTIEIKALKQQIEELNKDRYSLSECKEQLTSRLDETEMNVNMHQEALEKAVMQYSMEKAVLKDENVRLKTEIQDIVDSKKKLLDEIQVLQINVKEFKIEIDRLLREKSDIEKLLDRERNEKDGHRTKYDHDLSAQKEQYLLLVEKLSSNEAKLVSTEKEYSNLKNVLQDKQAQLDLLKDELNKLKLEFSMQENQYTKEKEERIRLLAKNETIEERLKHVIEENNDLKKKQQEFIDNHKLEKLQSVSLKELERKKFESEKEVNLLKQDLNILNQKLQNAELELNNQKNIQMDTLKNQLIQAQSFEHQQQEQTPIRNVQAQQFMRPSEKDNVKILDTDQTYLEESKKIKSELDQLRNDFQILLEKYETKENEQNNAIQETEQKYHDLIKRINSNKPDLHSLIANLQSKNNPMFDPYNAYNKQYPPNRHYHDQPYIPTYNPYPQHYAHYNPYNRLAEQNNRTTIIVPNCEIIIPKGASAQVSDIIPPINYSSYTNMGSSCDKCTTETQAYIDLLRSEITKAIEIQVAREVPFSSLNYKSSINTGDDIENDYKTSLKDNMNYSTANVDLMNSLRAKYFL